MSMTYEPCQDRSHPDVWRAEASDYESEGECYTVVFYGPRARQRAIEYAAWKNGQAEQKERLCFKREVDHTQWRGSLARPSGAVVQEVVAPRN